MEFRLVYEGSLKASGNKATHVSEKHSIRKQIHKQLAQLFECNPVLKYWKTNPNTLGGNSTDGTVPYLDYLADTFSRCGYRFVPLVHRGEHMVCSLNILFLRRENPGDLILPGGDVDNRIKTLLDALRMPETCNEIVGGPEASENPFFCLLQNDSLVTQLKVNTDRLLVPLKDNQHPNEVVLIIKVKIGFTERTLWNLDLG